MERQTRTRETERYLQREASALNEMKWEGADGEEQGRSYVKGDHRRLLCGGST